MVKGVRGDIFAHAGVFGQRGHRLALPDGDAVGRDIHVRPAQGAYFLDSATGPHGQRDQVREHIIAARQGSPVEARHVN